MAEQNAKYEDLELREKYCEAFEKEYRIIQDKLDKIGEFKFKIRGWSISVQAALIIAILTKEAIPTWAPIGLLFFIPLIFHLLERQQEHIGIALMDRAINLEKAIERLIFRRNESLRKRASLDSTILNEVQGSPRIGVCIRQRRRGLLSKKIIAEGIKNLKSRSGIWNLTRNLARFLKENMFYFFQYALFFLTLIIYHGDPQLFKKNSAERQTVHIYMSEDSEARDNKFMEDRLNQLLHGDILNGANQKQK
jgi:hypothetical protein